MSAEALVTEVVKIKNEIGTQMTELKTAIAKRDLEVKNLGEAREATGASIQQINTALEELNANYAKLEAEVTKLVTEENRPEGGEGEGDEEKSYGRDFVNSDSYQNAVILGKRANTDRVEVKSFLKRLDRKALTTAVGSGGAILTPTRVPGIFGSIQRPFRLRDLLVTNQTTDRTVEFVEESGFYHLYAQTASSSAAAQKAVVIDGAVTGFYVGQRITLSPNTLLEEVAEVAAVNTSTKTLTTKDNLTQTHPAGSEVVADEFAFTPETEIKPRARATFNSVQATMKTLAHWLPITRQMLANQAMLRSHIDTRLLEGLELSIEEQILYGNNGSNQLQGILTNPRTQTYSWSNGLLGDTQLDAIRRAITLAQLANYPVDGLIMHPIDFERIETLKGEDGHYLWVNVTEGGGQRLWRVPIVITTAIRQGDFLLGSFSMGAALWDGSSASIRVAEQHEDFFIRNMVVILAEQDATLANYRPESFVHGSFDEAPEE